VLILAEHVYLVLPCELSDGVVVVLDTVGVSSGLDWGLHVGQVAGLERGVVVRAC